MTNRRGLPVHSRRARRGYALLSVLWLCVGLVALVTAISAATREMLNTSSNRSAKTEAMWSARACAAATRAHLTAELGPINADGRSADRLWATLDALVAAAPLPAEFNCRVAAFANGTRLDANDTDTRTISRFLERNGVRSAVADSITALIVAERPFETDEELTSRLEAHGLQALAEFFGVRVGPVAVNHAPAEVLAAFPGFTDEVIARLFVARSDGRRVETFLGLLDGLRADVRGPTEAALPSLMATVTLEPSQWTLIARSAAGQPAVSAVLELQVNHIGGHMVVSRTRSWFE